MWQVQRLPAALLPIAPLQEPDSHSWLQMQPCWPPARADLERGCGAQRIGSFRPVSNASKPRWVPGNTHEPKWALPAMPPAAVFTDLLTRFQLEPA